MSESIAIRRDHTTAFAAEEKKKLIKSLRRFDMIFFTVCAIVGLDILGQVSSYGAETFTWVIVLGIAFLVPYGLLTAELGTAFPQEGGPYEWMRLSWGRFPAALGAVLYWVTNPFWVGGSLCFIATEAWSNNLSGIGTGSVGDYVFKLAFIWISIGVAIVSLRHGKWIPNAGAIARFAVLGFFSLTVIIYAAKHGVHGYGAGDFSPTKAVFIGLVPLLIFTYVGFELQSAAAEEMEDPQRDVPRSLSAAGILSVIAYSIPIFGILLVIPVKQITGIGGFLDAVTATFGIYGGAQNFLVDLMTLGFIFALVTSGAVWMIGSDRVQAAAGYDGAFIPWFGVFSRRFGTPVRVNVMSGVAATFFMVAAVNLLNGSHADAFTVVLFMAISTTLLSYLFIFPTVIKLRYSHPDVERPYRVPGGNAGVWSAGVVATLWILLAAWVAIFPDTIERALGVGYDFVDTWGVTQGRFEVFTLGTLAVVIAFGVVGYFFGRPVRAQDVDRPLGMEPEAMG
jgi:amino acid transporter